MFNVGNKPAWFLTASTLLLSGLLIISMLGKNELAPQACEAFAQKPENYRKLLTEQAMTSFKVECENLVAIRKSHGVSQK
jgi:hypothetical protein